MYDGETRSAAAHGARMRRMLHSFDRLLPGIIVILLAGSAAPAGRQSSRSMPDFAKARDEAITFLQDLVRIDTSGGNETKVAEYVKTVLDREGIPSEIVTLQEGRGNLVARLKGSGRKRPILLMGHTDVVGVESAGWTVEPFGAVVKDGYLYGRGSTDDKDNVAANLEVLLLLHRLKIPLDRDVICLAEAGEEGTPRLGIQFMAEKHWEKIDSEMVLAEGGSTVVRDGKVRYLAFATTEKVGRGMRLIARGTSGHGSVPLADNPIVHLAAAVAKVGQYQVPVRLNETTRMFFQGMATISPPDEAFLYTHIDDPVVGAMVQETLRRKYPSFNSMTRTSISPNIIKGGFRSNVIPAEAEVTLDVRAVPDEDIDALVAELKRLIDDPAVEIVRGAIGRPSPPPSPVDSDLVRALEKAAAATFPGAVTVPTMLTGATDMSFLRARGVQAYGIGPPAAEGERGAHGNDERLLLDGFGKFIELIYRTVVEVSADLPASGR